MLTVEEKLICANTLEKLLKNSDPRENVTPEMLPRSQRPRVISDTQ